MLKPFIILSAPRTKKNSATMIGVHTTAKPVLLPSKAYRKWFKTAMTQVPILRRMALNQFGDGSLPLAGPIEVKALFYRKVASGDLLGYEQALADFIQEPLASKKNPGKLKRNGAGLIKDDRQIVSWDGSRLMKDARDPRIEFWITALPGEQFSLLTEEEEEEEEDF